MTTRARPADEHGLAPPAAKRVRTTPSDASLRIQFKRIVFFRNLLQRFAKPLTETISLMCNEAGINVQAIDNSQTSMLVLNLPHTFDVELDHYACSKPTTLCVHVETLVTFLEIADEDVPLLITAEWHPKSEPYQIELTVLVDGHETGKRLPRHVLKLVNTDSAHNAIAYPPSVRIWEASAKRFDAVVKKFKKAKILKLYFDIVQSERQMVLHGQANNGQTEWPLAMTRILNDDSGRDVKDIPFATKLLVKLVEGCKMVETMTFWLDADAPLGMGFFFDREHHPDAYAKMFLVPSINDEDYMDDEPAAPEETDDVH